MLAVVAMAAMAPLGALSFVTPAQAVSYDPNTGVVVETSTAAFGALALDSHGDLFFTSGTQVQEQPAGGGPLITFANFPGEATGVAVDGAGDVFASDDANNTVVEFLAGGGQKDVGTGWNGPQGLAVDSHGDLFVADTNNNRVVEELAGGVTQVVLNTSPIDAPITVATDSAGDVFTTDFNSDQIVELPVGGGQNIVGSVAFPPGQIAVDNAGDFFYTDAADRRLVEFPSGGLPPVIIASGLDFVQGVAVDSSGDLYVSDQPNGGQDLAQIVYYSAVLPSPGVMSVSSSANAIGVTSDTPCPLNSTNTAALSLYNSSGTLVTSSNASLLDSSDDWAGSLSVPAGTPPGTYYVHAECWNGIDQRDYAYVAVTLSRIATTTQLTASANPSTVGEPVTFTATVAHGSGGAAPTGTVSFTDGNTALGSVPVTNGVAVLTTQTLPEGSAEVEASYSGDATYSPSAGALTQTVQGIATTTQVLSTANPGAPFQAVTYTAVVAPATGGGTPSGYVNFTVSYSTGSFRNQEQLVGGIASITTDVQPGGAVVEASYTGDGIYAPSTATLSEVAQPIATTTQAVAAPSTTTLGQPVNLTATVLPGSGSGTPTGTVTFHQGSSFLGTSQLSGGQATLTTSSLPVGSDVITAVYSGDDADAPSQTTVSETVDQIATATQLISSANPASFGQAVTFTATEVPASSTGPTPTGNVTFTAGSTTLGSEPLAGGTATLTTSSLPVGTTAVVASYSGDSSYLPSLATVSQVVQPAATVLVVAATTPTAANFAARLTSAVTHAGLVNQSVSFSLKNPLTGKQVALCSAFTGSSGIASCHTKFPTVGHLDKTYQAVYGGSADYAGASASGGL